MFKNGAFLFPLALVSNYLIAADTLQLHHGRMSDLASFQLLSDKHTPQVLAQIQNSLKFISQLKQNKAHIKRYQQYYQGIPVVGAQITITNNGVNDNNAQVNGLIINQVQLTTKPTLTPQQALASAKQSMPAVVSYPNSEKIELQIRLNQNKQPQLVYQVSFKQPPENDLPKWPFFIIDAHSGKILKTWDNIQNRSVIAPGGNEKVQEYWYGKNGLPFLEVSQTGATCTLEDKQVKTVNLHSEWDWSDVIRTPFSFDCEHVVENYVHGAYSVENDAYYFGHTIIDFYKDWYDVHALQDEKGNPTQLIMRVHFGSHHDNAFWDGQTMTFGDGQYFYPLVSLDVAAHEVSHGFTEHHADLEYHDESGSLNEAFSDMAGQTAKAYFLEKQTAFYNAAFLSPDTINWKIGDTLIGPELQQQMDAVRYMDLPSKDGVSADCYDKGLAMENQGICHITYADVLAYSKKYGNKRDRQSFIVHTASGIYNRAFYLLSQQIGIKKAFQIMLLANEKYWNPTTDFTQGACGTIYAAQDINENIDILKSVFFKVGIDPNQCLS